MITRDFKVIARSFGSNRLLIEGRDEKPVSEARVRLHGDAREPVPLRVRPNDALSEWLAFAKAAGLEYQFMQRRTARLMTQEDWDHAKAFLQRVREQSPDIGDAEEQNLERRMASGESRIKIAYFIRFASDRDAMVFAMRFPDSRCLAPDADGFPDGS